MHMQEEMVIGLLAFLVAFVCLIWAAADEGRSRRPRKSRRSDSSQELKDIENRL
jgi:hypothetical protein